MDLPSAAGSCCSCRTSSARGPEYRGPLFFYLRARLLRGRGDAAGRGRRVAAAGRAVRRGLLAAAVALMVIFAIPPVELARAAPAAVLGQLNVRVFHVVALAGAVLAARRARRAPAPAARAPPRGARDRRRSWRSPAPGSRTAAARRAAAPAARPSRDAVAKLVLFAGLGGLLLAAGGRGRVAAVPMAAAVRGRCSTSPTCTTTTRCSSGAGPPGPTGGSELPRRAARPFRISPSKPTCARRNVFPPNTPALYELEAPQGYDYPQSARWSRFSTRVLGEKGEPTPEFPPLAGRAPRPCARRPAADECPLLRRAAGRRAARARPHARVRAAATPPSTKTPLRCRARTSSPRTGRCATSTRSHARARRPRPAPGRDVPADAPGAVGAGGTSRRSAPAGSTPPTGGSAVPPGAQRLARARELVQPGLARGGGRGGDRAATRRTTRRRGSRVPRGARTVDIELDRTRIHVAAAISAISLLAIVLVMALGARRRRRSAPAA